MQEVNTANQTMNMEQSKNMQSEWDSTYFDEVLQALSEHANEAQRSIEARSEELQEAFLSILDHVLTSAGASREEKLIISLTEQGFLEIGEHSRQKIIAYLFEKTPQAVKIMQRLAADAMLKRGLECIKDSHKIEQQPIETLSDRIVFQSSIKGDLSHFYLV